MKTYIVEEKYYIVKAEASVETKFRTELSKMIISTYGKGPFSATLTSEIIKLMEDYFISKFREICLSETAVNFYKCIYVLHDNATELALSKPHKDISPEISREYIASYRRILKYIMEMGCDVDMTINYDEDYRLENSPISDLLYLGDRIISCVELDAEQTLFGNSLDVYFDDKELYVVQRKKYYEDAIAQIDEEFVRQRVESIVDENGVEDFHNAIKNNFGMKYWDVLNTIQSLIKSAYERGEDLVSIGIEELQMYLQHTFAAQENLASVFFSGLQLKRSNKMSLDELVRKPYKLNRALYKPIIIWSINGKAYAQIGLFSFIDALQNYVNNAIPWGKAPDEWMGISDFKKYVHAKEDEHDKWLEDAVEEVLIGQNILFDRNIKKLKADQGYINLEVKDLGEVDFIVISNKLRKIFIVDCKHLLGRYDMINQKNDFNAFTRGSKNSKAYNKTMANKVAWFKKNQVVIRKHFSSKYPSEELLIEDYSIEGIFIINTPTYYMYNPEFRIYTIGQTTKLFIGEY